MKRVTKIQTIDGKLHDTERAAAHHAEVVYGLVLTSLAQRALQKEKYVEMCAFIEENIDSFVKLKALKEDIEMEEDAE